MKTTKRNYKIFYSWQSYIGGKANREYIQEQIQSSCNKLGLNATILEDSRGTTGAADIPNIILSKIIQSDIFICDITPVNTIDLPNGKKRAIPNPNVMFELGFAVRSLGWDMVLLVVNQEYGDVEFMPFDISKHTIITYRRKEGVQESDTSLELEDSIKKIIDNYDELIELKNSFDYRKHDIEIYNKLMSFMTEKEFINSINELKSAGWHSKWDSNGWYYIKYFQDYPQNRFISSVLNETYLNLSKAIDELEDVIIPILNPFRTDQWIVEEPDVEYSQEELRIIQESQKYMKREIPYPDNESEEAYRDYINKVHQDILVISNACSNVLQAYTVFRDSVKKVLFV